MFGKTCLVFNSVWRVQKKILVHMMKDLQIYLTYSCNYIREVPSSPYALEVVVEVSYVINNHVRE